MADNSGAPASGTGSREPSPAVSALTGFDPSRECPLCEGSGTAFMFENVRDCSLCLGEGQIEARFADYYQKMGEAQASLFHLADSARERRDELEEAVGVLLPWVEKFASAASHYDIGAPRFKGSTLRYDPCPNYEGALTSWAFGEFPGAPINGPTVGDLRMMRDALALVRGSLSRDTDGSPKGRDAQQFDGAAATAGAEGIAETSAPQSGDPA